MKNLIALIALSMLVSCGDPSALWPGTDATVYKTQPAQAEGYSYELRSNSCSTGEHGFATFENACQALGNDELNNDCAKDERKELFTNSQCPGNFS